VIENILCRTIGCGSVFSHWFEWPYRLICNKYVLWKDLKK
jgi:hypothetical protein